MKYSEHVALKHMAQIVKLCMSIGKMFGPPKKDITWWSVTGCVCNKERANCSTLKEYQLAGMQAYPLFPKRVLENKKLS